MTRAGAAPGRSTRSATDGSGDPLTLRRVVRDLLLVGVLAVAGAALLAGYAVFRIEQQGSWDEARPAGAIVVLGAAQYNGRPSAVFAARIDHAVALWRAGIAPLLVMTGGKLPGDLTTEAAVARAYAMERGVPEASILVEDRGRSTLESLEAVAVILRHQGIADAVFVSDRTHMLRVLRMARDEGVVAFGSPTRTGPAEGDLVATIQATLHELGGLVSYFLVETATAPDRGAPAAGPNAP